MSSLFGSSKLPAAQQPVKPSAPVTESAVEVASAKRTQRRDLLRRQGLGSTIIAGGNPGLKIGKELLGGGS